VKKAKRKDETEVKTSEVGLEDDEKANDKSLNIPKEIKTIWGRPNELRSEDLQS
jgi:hypothetical protein